MEPFVTLHHFDTPLPYFQDGHWLNRKLIDKFVDYAKICFEAFGDRVKKWATFNEPWSIAQNGYIAGNFPPNETFQIAKAIQIEHNLMVAHARALSLYKSMNLPGEIGIVHTLEGKVPISDKPEDRHARDLDDAISNRFMLDACFLGHYSDETMALIGEILEKNHGTLVTEPSDFEDFAAAAGQIDFLGMNYYSSHFLQAWDGESKVFNNSTGEKGTSVFALKGIGARVSNPDVPTTDWDWPIYPQGMHDQLRRIARDYPNYKKIYISENGMGYKIPLKTAGLTIRRASTTFPAISKPSCRPLTKGSMYRAIISGASWTCCHGATATTSATAFSTSTTRIRSAIRRRAHTGTVSWRSGASWCRSKT